MNTARRTTNCCMRFSNGDCWDFLCAPELKPWLKEFGHILGLPNSTERSGFGTINVIPMSPLDIDGKDRISYKQGSAYRVSFNPEISDICVEINPDFIDDPEIRYLYMSACLKPIFHHYTRHGKGCMMHCASASWNGKGVLIVADGGVGKSTCYRRLPGHWHGLADDMALIVRDASGHGHIHPMPTWSDYLEGTRKSTVQTTLATPLKAIFFLEQAQTDKVEAIPGIVAANDLYRICRSPWGNYLDRLPVAVKKLLTSDMFSSCADLVNEAPSYRLQATLDGRFWTEMEKVL